MFVHVNGFDGANFTNTDKCLNDPCCSNAKCTNTSGSYTCSYLSGLIGNRVICIDLMNV